jgi:hypothetical protein
MNNVAFARQITGGKGKCRSNLEQLISQTQGRYACTDSFYDQIYLLGEIEGIETGVELTHRECIRVLVDAKRDIREMQEEDPELFSYEINFKKGFIAGTEKVLQQNRAFFTVPAAILIVGLFENEGLLEKSRLAARIGGFEEIAQQQMQMLHESRHNQFFFTTSIEDFIGVLTAPVNDEVDVTVNVVYESNKARWLMEKLDSLPPMELFRLNIIRMHGEGNGRNGHWKRDKAEKLLRAMIENVSFLG